MIPNPAMWLLPEFQDLAAGLATTLSLPDNLLHGAFVTPTGDGFLINMPTCEALSEIGQCNHSGNPPPSKRCEPAKEACIALISMWPFCIAV